MIKKFIFLVIFIILLCLNFIKAQNFYISLGSGFKDDTISLSINNRFIIHDKIVNSNPILGYSPDALIIYKNDSIKYLNDNKVVNTTPFSYNKKLRIILSINGMPYALYAYPKKGKYIVISKHLHYYNVYINQYKKSTNLE